jgi:predicted alpha-1,2-mannosidase
MKANSVLVILFSVCSAFSQNPVKDNIQYVNPFIGTKNMGHTFPGAAAPFGMVQLSPETNIEPMFKNGKYNPETYKYCSGYQYDDTRIYGFAHTHFSGTGHSDLGDLLIMPIVGELNLNDVQNNYFSTFSHTDESAQPGYYKVKLDTYNVLAELTSSERVGFHQYTFPKSNQSHILLDLVYNIYNHEDKNVWTFVRVENDSTITGYRQTNGWGRTRTVYFAMKFSKPFKSFHQKRYDQKGYNGFYRRFNENDNFPEIAGKNIRIAFDFDTAENEEIKVKMALSSVSTEGAMLNMNAEVPHWNFENLKKVTQAKWNNELSKIQIESLSKDDKTVFYTSLYHTMLSPVIYEDADKSYRGLDQNIHKSEGFTNYTIFSLWDTFRSLHPLYNIIQPKRNNDMIHSMLAHQEQSVHKMLPVWSHYSNENWCMIGYHSVPVIADAIVKNNFTFDPNKALNACVATSNVKYYGGLEHYLKKGYAVEDKVGSSASTTLEYAYDDWCIAQIAAKLNDKETASVYAKRAQNYQTIFDPKSKFMRPRNSNGEFVAKFDPLDTHGQGFIEGNSWTYSLFVPHNPDKLIEMMGGKVKFSIHLDSLFTMKLDDKYIEKNEDITRDGIIGNYVHGNEPGHHIPYLYNWTDKPYKAQQRVRMILKTMYGPNTDGLCGNDDAGQMSAWYIFSALGFYPVAPGSPQYALGSPNVVQAEINLDNGKKFKITTQKQSDKNIYVKKVLLNGIELKRNYILHDEIMNGGELVFYMSDKPNKK